MAAPKTNEEKFDRWVIQPIGVLRKLGQGDGAFAALGIACGLYERFVKASLHKAGTKGTPEAFRKFAAADLGCSEDAVDRFWNGYRLGLQHAFHPKNYVEKEGKGDRWGWQIAEGAGYQKQPEIIKIAEAHFVVRIDPWKFVEHVVTRWRENFGLIDELQEFSLGSVSED
jgi:hypothetical protein